MTAPTSPRRAATRERLVRAAIGVIARKGVLGASVEEICEAADFTRGAFYSNFDSKDELCIAILEQRTQQYLASVRQAIAEVHDDLTVMERVDHAVTSFITSTGDSADQVLVMSELRLHAAREPGLRAALNALDEAVTPLFGELVTDGLAAQGLRLTIDLADALSLLQAVHDQTALDQLIRGEAPNAPRAAARLGAVLRAMIEPA